MSTKFRKPGMGERIQQLGYLLKNTVTIIGRDTDIIGPWLRTVIYAAVMITAFFGGVLAYTLGASGIGTLLLCAAFLLFFYKYFYYTRQDMAQSWLVAETVRGRDAVPGDGRKRVRGLKSQARGLGWAALVFAYIKSRADGDGEKRGIIGSIIRLVLAGLYEVWDLAKHFLAPAITVDEYSLRDGLGELKTLRNSVPETLVGVFGIDIAGGAARTLMAPIYIVLVLAALGLGVLIGNGVPAFYAGDITSLLGDKAPAWMDGHPLPLNLLPLLVVLWLGKLFGAILARVVDSVKIIYFTLFYMRITHPADIAPDLREELTAYLRIETEPAGQPTGQLTGEQPT